jgi:S-methylmethionine-dependent homocysteine/selenocysteine methylase
MIGRLAYELADAHAQAGEYILACEGFDRAAQRFEEAGQFINRSGALEQQAQQNLAMGDRAGAVAAWKTALSGLDHAEDQDAAEEIRKWLRAKLRRVAADG